MIGLVYQQDDVVTAWVRQRLPEIRNGFGLSAAIGVHENGKLIAGVVYHEFRGYSMQLSMASDSPRWCTRRTLQALLSYPFCQLNVARITACTAKSNRRLRSLVERLGFRLEGTIRKGFDGTQDLLVYGMLRAEANKWIRDDAYSRTTQKPASIRA